MLLPEYKKAGTHLSATDRHEEKKEKKITSDTTDRATNLFSATNVQN